ncbi:unnamed protein product [Lupinus luteus]|uniref:DUF2470 domain-containing protein n=1 Tax=Lupinus luteus TaxID=3873 RepID=A0AAV1XPB8_LUPLU
MSEFSGGEYKAAKVDPIAHISKPVASHMNNDHADDTKVIVKHWTSVPVSEILACLFFSARRESDDVSPYVYLMDHLQAGYQGSSFKLRVPFPRRTADRNLPTHLCALTTSVLNCGYGRDCSNGCGAIEVIATAVMRIAVVAV